jgi:hypothetical protein
VTACVYCHRPGATFRINADELAHFPCFERADAADEAAMFAAMASPAFEPAEPSELLRIVPREDLTGRRFGRLVVLGPAVRQRRNGYQAAEWRVRCDCGRTSRVSRSNLLQRGTHQCKPCVALANADRSRRHPFSVIELSRRSGIGVQTIRNRIRLGWPPDRLVAPKQRPPTIGNTRRAA